MISQDALIRRVQDLEAKLANKANTAVAPKNVSAPRYERNSDFYQYLKKFNIFASAKSWGPAECVRVLPALLDGEALEIYLGLENADKNTWRILTEAIAAKTGKMDPQSSAKQRQRIWIPK
jgi:hypothetical protein